MGYRTSSTSLTAPLPALLPVMPLMMLLTPALPLVSVPLLLLKDWRESSEERLEDWARWVGLVCFRRKAVEQGPKIGCRVFGEWPGEP